MLEMLYPGEYLDSTYEIDFEGLSAEGYRGLIFDIDNTLVYQDEDSTPEVEALFERLRMIGFKTFILSNNSEERVRRFAKKVSSPYLSGAHKPLKIGYERALSILGVRREQAVFLGDRLLTDILGARRCGIWCILVEYIKTDGEKPDMIRRLEGHLYKRKTE